jgi:hypothetical protein
MQKISSYIIFTRNVKEITVQAEMLYARSSWDSRGLFLVVVTVKVPKSEELALSIIRELWQIGRGYNVMVVVQQDDLLNLYTWFPYSSHDNCADVKNVVLMNQWVMEGEGKFLREGSLYPRKIPSNFHGCTLNLSAFLKIDLVDELSTQYFVTHNITRNYVNEFSDLKLPLGNALACLQSLWDRESDMVYGALPLVLEEFIHGEPTFPYLVLQANWFVPCPKPLSHFREFHKFSPPLCGLLL